MRFSSITELRTQIAKIGFWYKKLFLATHLHRPSSLFASFMFMCGTKFEKIGKACLQFFWKSSAVRVRSKNTKKLKFLESKNFSFFLHFPCKMALIADLCSLPNNKSSKTVSDQPLGMKVDVDSRFKNHLVLWSSLLYLYL